MSHGADSTKSIIFALCANAAIALSKFVAAAMTGSGAMLAEAIHSLADTGNLSRIHRVIKDGRVYDPEVLMESIR